MLHYLLTLLQGGLVFNRRRLAIISPPLIKLHGLSLAARIKFKSLMLAYKGRTGSAPSDSNSPVPGHAAPVQARQSRLFWTPQLFQAFFLLSCCTAPSPKYQLVSCNRSHLWPVFTFVFYHLCAADSFSSRVAVRPPRRLQIPSALG